MRMQFLTIKLLSCFPDVATIFCDLHNYSSPLVAGPAGFFVSEWSTVAKTNGGSGVSQGSKTGTLAIATMRFYNDIH